jgi:hypothetical protein
MLVCQARTSPFCVMTGHTVANQEHCDGNVMTGNLVGCALNKVHAW